MKPKPIEYDKYELITNPMLRHNLDNIHKTLHTSDVDWTLACLGMEGSGKSLLAQRLACYYDPTFCVERICFSAEEFQQGLIKAKPFQAIILDEGSEALFTRDSMTFMQKEIDKTLTGIRWKNLLIIVCIADFYMLETWFKGHRLKNTIRMMVNTSGGTFQKGYYGFYSKKRMQYIRRHKETKATIYPRANFYGRCKDIDKEDQTWDLWKKYLDKKKKFGNVARNEKVWNMKLQNERRLKNYFTINQMAIATGVKKNTIRSWIYQKRIFPKKVIKTNVFGEKIIRQSDFKKYMAKYLKIRGKNRGRPKKKKK